MSPVTGARDRSDNLVPWALFPGFGGGFELINSCRKLQTLGPTLPSPSLYGVFPVPLGQFVSVTYPRRTFSHGSRDLKRFGREEK